MWLPFGIKSLAEIRGLSKPEDRVPAYATLLQLILRTLTPDIGTEPSLNNLVEFHQSKFTRPKRVFFANSVRNDLVHALGQFSAPEWTDAAKILDEAIEDVCRFVPVDMREEVAGRRLGGTTGAASASQPRPSIAGRPTFSSPEARSAHSPPPRPRRNFIGAIARIPQLFFIFPLLWGLLFSATLGTGACTILFLRANDSPRTNPLPFEGYDHNDFWKIGFFLGVAVGLICGVWSFKKELDN
jgi:hypothetical protein